MATERERLNARKVEARKAWEKILEARTIIAHQTNNGWSDKRVRDADKLLADAATLLHRAGFSDEYGEYKDGE